MLTVVILTPLGLLMGMPFQADLRFLGQRTDQTIPWAWAINATTSVLGSVVAVLMALHYGFTAAAWFGAAMYFMAAWFIPGLRPAIE